MSYPVNDPHPVGALTAGDENYQKTVLYTTGAYNANQRNTNLHTQVCAFGNYVYYMYVDINRRPHIVKINLTTQVADDKFFGASNYLIPDDNHYMLSVSVDEHGYIHVTGDMENHGSDRNSSLIKVAPYTGSDIMYWISDYPEDHENFSFYGHDSLRAPTGYMISYAQLKRDMNGTIYFKARIHVHRDGSFNQGARGLSIQRYNVNTRTWTELGGYNPAVFGHTPIYKSVFWMDSGEAWMSPPYPIEDNAAFYQGFYNSFEFDIDNVMHFCYPGNNVASLEHSTEVIYFCSRDGGNTFERADGTVLTAPVRGSRDWRDVKYYSINANCYYNSKWWRSLQTGNQNHTPAEGAWWTEISTPPESTGDIVGSHFQYSDTGSVTVDWGGKPVVGFDIYASIAPNAAAVSPPKTRIYRNGVWESAIDMTLNRSMGSWSGSGNDGILMFCAINATGPSYTTSEIYRTRRYGETGYTIEMGAAMGGADWITYKRFGRLYMTVADATSQMLVELTFTSQVYDDLGIAGAKQINKRMLL